MGRIIKQQKRFLLFFLLLASLTGTLLAQYLFHNPKDLQKSIAANIFGDANGDGRVDILDFQLLSNSFGKLPGQTGYDSRCDFNSSNTVDILDFQILSNNFGGVAATNTPIVTQPVTPTGTPNSSFQPSAPYYGTFFYPWSENPNTEGHWSYWDGSGTNPPSTWFSHYLPDFDTSRFDPATELYSAKNDTVLNWQLTKLKEAKIEVAISSWWGQNERTDIAFRKIVTDTMNRNANPYPNLRWTIYYEKEGFADPAVDTELVPDLIYILNNYANQKGFFRINGRPVIFVYNAAHSGSNPLNDLSRWQQAKTKVKAATGVDLYVVLKTDPLNAGVSETAIDSWHEYGPASRIVTKAPYWSFVSPGFWLDNGSGVRLGRDLNAFRSAVQTMVNTNVTWKLIETWNEWGEGTSVEPGEQVITVSGNDQPDPNGTAFKNAYIDVLKSLLPPLE